MLVNTLVVKLLSWGAAMLVNKIDVKLISSGAKLLAGQQICSQATNLISNNVTLSVYLPLVFLHDWIA